MFNVDDYSLRIFFLTSTFLWASISFLDISCLIRPNLVCIQDWQACETFEKQYNRYFCDLCRYFCHLSIKGSQEGPPCLETWKKLTHTKRLFTMCKFSLISLVKVKSFMSLDNLFYCFICHFPFTVFRCAIWLLTLVSDLSPFEVKKTLRFSFFIIMGTYFTHVCNICPQ